MNGFLGDQKEIRTVFMWGERSLVRGDDGRKNWFESINQYFSDDFIKGVT